MQQLKFEIKTTVDPTKFLDEHGKKKRRNGGEEKTEKEKHPQTRVKIRQLPVEPPHYSR